MAERINPPPQARGGFHYRGPLPDLVWDVLELSRSGLSIASNPAREMATEVSLAASLGWVSTVSPDGRTYSRIWHITVEGLHALTNKERFLSSC